MNGVKVESIYWQKQLCTNHQLRISLSHTHTHTHTQTSPSAPVCADSPMWEHISIVKSVCRWVSSVTAVIRDRGGKKYLISLGRKTLVSKEVWITTSPICSHALNVIIINSLIILITTVYLVTVVILSWQRRSQHTLRARPQIHRSALAPDKQVMRYLDCWGWGLQEQHSNWK